jgi:hypothetical protein
MFLDGELPENRRLLRKITDAGQGPQVHGHRGDVLVTQHDPAAIGRNQADHDMERSGLASAVRSQQPDHLAGMNLDAHIVHHTAATIAFLEIFGAGRVGLPFTIAFFSPPDAG